MSDLDARLAFVLEIDALKTVLRRNSIRGGERRENTAEHSWHLALMAIVLAPHSDAPIDTARVVAMLLVHDLVEIDAGDTFAYDDVGALTKSAREEAAADRIFAILPPAQAAELRSLWDEFESGTSDDARYARAVDRLAPMLLNYENGGALWREHALTAARVRARNAGIADGSTALWAAVEGRIDDAERQGWFEPD
jgi:putative hydrolase of HD superfamily